MSKKMVVVLFDVGASNMLNQTVFINIEDDRPDLVDDYMDKAIELAVIQWNEAVDEDDAVTKDMVYDYYAYDENVIVEAFKNDFETI